MIWTSTGVLRKTSTKAVAGQRTTLLRLLSFVGDGRRKSGRRQHGWPETIGTLTSHAASHVGAYGRPVPSRLSELSEIWALAGELGQRGVGVVEATWGPDLFVDEFARLAQDINRPVSWAAIMATRRMPAYAPDVVARTEKAGGYVRPGTPVAKLIMMDPIMIDVNVSARTANRLQIGELVSYTVHGSDERFQGRIYEKSTIADPRTRTFRVSLMLPNERRRG